MTEEINFIIDSAKESMEGSVTHLEKEFLNIRAGKASPQMLGGVFVDYYGSQTALSQVANVNAVDARTLTVTPWEKTMLQPIEKAIMIANLGLNPMNNGENIIINIQKEILNVLDCYRVNTFLSGFLYQKSKGSIIYFFFNDNTILKIIIKPL